MTEAKRLKEDVEVLFTPEFCVPGFSPSHEYSRTATTLDKARGRIQQRTLTASSQLKGYLDWPYAQQVFRLERRFRRLRDYKRTKQTTCGVTNLAAADAHPERLLSLTRARWGIENKLHYPRDETLREDRCRLIGQGARAMAAVNNLVLGLLRKHRTDYIPDVHLYYAAHLAEAVAPVTRSSAPG